MNLTPGSRRPGALAFRLAAGLALTAIALLAPTRAEAGTYTATLCSSLNPGPGGASWERTTDHYRSRTRCASGEGLQAYHDADGSRLGQFGAWVWRAPAGTVFTHVQANASLTRQAGHWGELVARRADGAYQRLGGEHSEFRVEQATGEFVQLHSWLRCAAPGDGSCGRAGNDSAHAYVKGVFLRTEDRAAPALTGIGGPLLAAPVVRGTQPLGFTIGDRGGGVRSVSVAANGAVLHADVRNCSLRDGFATALVPCPTSTQATVAVPTAHPAFATGPNTVTACAEDLALDGIANRVCAPRRVWVDNACPGSAAAAAGFTAELAAGSPAAPVRSDRSGLVTGRVAGPSGTPVAGATVCALARVLVDGAPILVAATARSGPDGAYAIELPPGPSRELYVHLAHGDRVLARHGLVLRSRAVPSLAIGPRPGPARNGSRLTFNGSLPGPACADRVVVLQALVGKRRWRAFRTTRSDAACAFAARYRLRSTERPTTYRFRALVPPQQGYPYESGHSEVRRKRVKPR